MQFQKRVELKPNWYNTNQDLINTIGVIMSATRSRITKDITVG